MVTFFSDSPPEVLKIVFFSLQITIYLIIVKHIDLKYSSFCYSSYETNHAADDFEIVFRPTHEFSTIG